VHRHHLVDVDVGQVENGARHALAGVVDPDVEAAQFVDSGVGDGLEVSAARRVGDDGDGATAGGGELVGETLQLRLAPGGQYECMTIGGESPRDACTDAGARAGDYDRLVWHLSGHLRHGRIAGT